MSVRTTMTLTDKMTGTLQKMMKAMNSTIRAMEQMHTASNRSMDMRSLQRARRDIESAQASFNRLQASARQAGSEGQNAGNRIRNGFNSASAGANAATSSVRQLLASFTGFAAAYLSIQGIANGFSKFTQASDNYSNSNARLNNINDGLQTQAGLQDKIYKASQRSLSSYNDTAASVAKLNLLAKDAFGSNDEAIRFTELMNKSFSVSGASTQEKQAGMYQLTQAMAAGRLQGDEFRSIMENAPLLAQAIGDATGVGMEGLKKMSAEGTITASVIKSSLFGAAKDIEDKFNSMPLTFADAMTVFNNWAQKAFEPMFIRFRQFVNSDAFGILAGHAMVFVNLFVSGLSLVFDALEAVYNGIGSFGQILESSWSLVGPVIITAAVALGSYLAILVAYRGVMMIIAAYEAARAFALGVMAAATMIATGATFAQTAAQLGLNTAILAFPGTWILIAFIAVIAIVVNAMIMWKEQTAAVIGAIVGGISWLGAAFYNVLIGVANLAIVVAEWFVNAWNQAIFYVQLAWIAFNLMVRIVLDAIGNKAITTAEWIANTFNDAVYGVQMAFYTMGTMVLKVVGGVADGIFNVINKALGGISDLINGAIGGVNSFIGLLNGVLDTNLSTIGTVDLKMSKGASNFADKFQNLFDAPTRANKVVLDRMNTAQDYMNNVTMPSAPVKQQFERLEYENLGDVYAKGNKAGQSLSMAASEKLGGLVDKAKGLMGLGKDDKNKDNPFSDAQSLMDNVMNTAPSETGLGASGDPDKGKLKGGKLDTVGKIEDKINLADEYLELFKDIAEGKAINNIVSLTPNLQVHNNFEDTAGSILSKVLGKMDDFTGLKQDGSKLNTIVSAGMSASSEELPKKSMESHQRVAQVAPAASPVVVSMPATEDTTSLLSRAFASIHKVNDANTQDSLLSRIINGFMNRDESVLNPRDPIAVDRDQINVPQTVREKVSGAPITNNNSSKSIVQHVKSEPKFYFTGDIHKEVDVEDVIKAITQGLKDDQERSTEGVYG